MKGGGGVGLRRGEEGGKEWKTEMHGRKTMAGERAAAEWKRVGLQELR